LSDKLLLKGIFSKGYGVIPKLVMKDENLTIEAKSIYAYICSYAGSGNSAFPSVSLICHDLGISENRFYKHRKLLVDNGYITITKERTDTGWSNNIYIINSEVHLQNKGTHKEHLQNVGIQNVGIQNVGIQNEGTNNNNLNNNSNTNNINNNKQTSNKLPEKDLKSDFESIWKEYPNKKGKAKAFVSYKKAIKDGVDNQTIMNGISAYKKEIDIKRTEPEYIAHGSTWFSQQRWEDDYQTKGKVINSTFAQEAPTSADNLQVSDEEERMYQEYLRKQGKT
jgi:hypothetical protein